MNELGQSRIRLAGKDLGAGQTRLATGLAAIIATLALGGCYQRRYEPANWQSPGGRRPGNAGLAGDGTTLPTGTTLPFGTTLPTGTTLPYGTTLPAPGAAGPGFLDGTTLPGPVR